MKKICLISLGVLAFTFLHGQPWLENLPAHKPKSELTFFDYQKAFETWAMVHPRDKDEMEGTEEDESGSSWEHFKRWEYDMHGVVDKITGAFPGKSAQQVYEEFYKSHPQPRTRNASDWTSLGPNFSYSGYAGIGRLNCIAFHPTDINTYWVGAAAGGLWMTSDNGNSWSCLTDHNGVLGVSDIIIPSDYDSTQTIYIATGDREIWDNRSIGVLKSIDGGHSWNPTGLSFTIFDGAMTNRLLIDPDHPNVLIAATTWGVYKTEDGGITWNHQLTGTEFIDMEYQPGNFNLLQGSTKYGQIYYSDNGGESWNQSFTDPAAHRIELAVSPNQPTWVYALAASDDSGLYGVFKSTDSGLTYNQVFYRDTANLLTWAPDGQDGGGQGWYDLSLAVSPTNANTVLLGGVNTWQSLDGGVTWKLVSHWAGDQAQAVHADKHMLRYRYNRDVFECNDGGVYLSRNNGQSWKDKSNGIVNSEMYRLGVSQTEPGDVITGLQDNGSKVLSAEQWYDVKGGDGFECWIDYTDVNIQYATLYFGQLDRTDDHWNGSVDITPYQAGDGAWLTPYVIDPVDPNILYGGFKDLWRSADKGESWDSISAFNSPNLLQSLAVAPSDHQVIYAADYNTIRMTRDTGADWNNITFNLPSNAGGIEYISVKHDDPNTAWVALSGYSVPGVYQYSGLDSTWTNISSGLPPIPVYCVIENKQSTKELQLFAGTELGIYLKRGDRDWIPYTNGLPNVRVGEIEMYYAVHPGDSRLRAATYGRGLWESPVPAAPEGGLAVSNAPVCFGQSAALNLAEYFGDIQWQQSADGVSGWENVTAGSGANDPDYLTDGLTSTLYYRAEVSQPEFEPQYSNVIEIPILPLPDDAGPISGIQTLCEGSQGILFSIDSVANATSYTWTLPDGVNGSSTTDSITVNFSSAKGNVEIQVHAKRDECDGGSSSLIVTIMPNPVTPQPDSTTQPTCTVPTGIIHLTNLPDSGTWVLTNLVDSSSITGEGSTYDLVDLLPGLYYYSITNARGCSSGSSGAMVVLPQPVTPGTPTITVNEYVLHSDAPDGNQWYDDNGPIPGATEQDYTATSGGHYYVIVTLNGCSSPASNTIELFNEGIDPGPLTPSITIFPNPMKEEMNIKVNGIRGVLQYSVINALGQVVSHGSMTHETMVNTSSFSPGLYLVRVSFGKYDMNGKVVKE